MDNDRKPFFSSPDPPPHPGAWLSVLQAEPALWSNRRKPKAGLTLSGYQEIVQTLWGRLNLSEELDFSHPIPSK